MEETTKEGKTEEFKINGEDLLRTVKDLIKEGHARRIIIKTESGDIMLEIPLTIGAIGAVIAPMLAAVGALAALLTRCTIVVVKREAPAAQAPQETPQEPVVDKVPEGQ